MKISFQNKTKNLQVEIPEDIDIYETMTHIRGLLIAWGFHQDSVLDGCEYIIEEYGKELDASK